MGSPMLRVDNVSKRYVLGQIGGTTLRDELQRTGARLRGREDPTRKIGARDYNRGEAFMALDGVSFDVGKGERVGIIGRNGAGKSTLLKLISRVTAPTGGMIGLNGRVASMLEVGTGFHGELTGRENIYMNGAILGMTRREIDAKIEDIIEFSECRQFIDTPVKRYSSGMYVKLAFSVAAHLDSEIMIMDEVLAVGDMAFQKKCLDKMNDVSKTEGRTILYVSHNMSTIRSLCDRVIVLDHGKVVLDGDVETGIEAYSNAHADSRVFYDLASVEHSPSYKRTLEMRSIAITDQSTNQVVQGKEFGFLLRCKANDNAENVHLRLETYFGDGSIVGTSFSDRSFSAHRGEILEMRIAMDMKNYVPGRYKCAALLFQLDEYGNEVPLDKVDPAMTFEIISEGKGEMVWLHRWWGHIRLNDLHVESISRL